jgi:hypothetical protein
MLLLCEGMLSGVADQLSLGTKIHNLGFFRVFPDAGV